MLLQEVTSQLLDQGATNYNEAMNSAANCGHLNIVELIGEYRGAAHSICNLQFRKPKFTPILFHNSSYVRDYGSLCT